jgi:hypothetical protein
MPHPPQAARARQAISRASVVAVPSNHSYFEVKAPARVEDRR